MTILQWLLQTDSGVVGLILRITLAVVMFPRGAQKVFGWFGGPGFKGTMKYLTDSGIPTVFALLAIAAEFLGSLCLAVGFLTRIAAFGIACGDARCYRHSSRVTRLFHELVRQPERRGV
jgi:putative oxidoreductase